MTTTSIRSLFHPAPGTVYLDAATYGLPPAPTVRALQEGVRAWQAGTARWIDDWDRRGETCRDLFAALIGAGSDEIALVPTVSVGVAPVAASLRAGDEVVIPDDEFTSVLFPILVANEQRPLTVRRVDFDRLAEEIGPTTRLVAFSLVRSQEGRTARLADICDAARRHGVRVLVDATHAIPFVPVADQLGAIDYLVCHGYKHLLCPRGVGFLYVRRDRWDDLPPIHANWRTGDPLYHASYGGELDLLPNAARFDVSLDWLAWVGAAESLKLLVEWQRAGALAPVRDLAAELAARLGVARPGGSIVALPVADAAATQAALAEAGIRVAAPAGQIRISPHVYNTREDVERIVSVLAAIGERVGVPA